MTKETTPGELQLGEVQVTIEVVRGPVHSGLANVFAGRWVRALVAVAGLAAGVVVGVMIVNSPGSGLSRGRVDRPRSHPRSR